MAEKTETQKTQSEDMEPKAESETAVTIRVDGREISAQPGQLLIQACLDAGIHIPHFCYHPRMSPVGMCRMCLVEADTGRGPAITVSCVQPVTENMEVFTETDTVKKVQDGILEFLLLNHPLDCPVCDKGGECPLQDQTMAFGPGESRFVEEKRHFLKPIPVSSLVFLDRERCILCDRCTRFADEVAGDPLISFQGRGRYTEINTFPDMEFSSYFSGNTVQVCPVGALTAEPYRFKARPWDLIEQPSTYPNPMGDRIILHASGNQVVRIQGMDSAAVNWSWLTDKDRFAFQALESPNRIVRPLVRKERSADLESGNFEMGGASAGDGTTILEEVPWFEALMTAATMVKTTLAEKGPGGIAVLGGASLPNEDQYVWAKLAKGKWGTDNVDCQVGDGLPPEVVLGLSRTTLNEALCYEGHNIAKNPPPGAPKRTMEGSVVLFIGADLKEDLGTLYLRLRHGILNDGVVLIELTPTETSLTKIAEHSFRVFPGDTLDAVEDLLAGSGDYETAGQAMATAAEQGKLTVIYGRSSLAESSGIVSSAIQALAKAQPSASFLPILRHANIFGALDMGLAPGILPGRVSLSEGQRWYLNAWGKLPEESGKPSHDILKGIADGKISTLILLGEDPLGSFPDARLLREAINHSPGITSKLNIVVLDKFMSSHMAQFADVVLPVAALGEREGTHTNLEGRISPLNKIVSAPGTVRCDWEIAMDLARLTGADMDFENLTNIWEEISEVSPHHVGTDYAEILNSQDGFTNGLISDGSGLADSGTKESKEAEGFPTQLTGFEPTFNEVGLAKDNYSYRLIVRRSMFDGEIWTAECSSLAELGRPQEEIRLNPIDFKKLGITPGSNVEVRHMGGSIDKSPLILVAIADPGVPPMIAAMNFSPPTLREDISDPHSTLLIDSDLPVNDILIQPVRPPSTDPFVR